MGLLRGARARSNMHINLHNDQLATPPLTLNVSTFIMDEPYGQIKVLVGHPLAWARAHPSFFFPGAVLKVELLVEYLLEGARALGSIEAEARFFDDWSVVASASDWFAGAKFPIPEDFAFENLTPFPELRDNCVRPEVLVAAFSAEVVVHGPTGTYVVKGPKSAGETISRWLAASPQWSRAVAFRGLSV
jgi:hypothetical protein